MKITNAGLSSLSEHEKQLILLSGRSNPGDCGSFCFNPSKIITTILGVIRVRIRSN